MQPLVPGHPTSESVNQTRLDFLKRYDRDPEFAAQFGCDRETFIAQLTSSTTNPTGMDADSGS